jgi:hypothetical protein
MSARKLSRLAGLVFVLAAAFGGVGAASVSAERDAGGAQAAAVQAAGTVNRIDVIWT